MRRSFLGALGLAAVLMLIPLTSAIAVYPPNAGAAWLASGTFSGLRGTAYLYSATPLAGHVIAHPAQVSSKTNSDFIGIGTYKGAAISGTNCGAYSGSGWQGYVDGKRNGTYFCDKFGGTFSATGSYWFVLSYNDPVCAGRWYVVLGSQTECLDPTFTAARMVSVGGESAKNGGSPSIQNIAVQYTGVEARTGTTWSTPALTSSADTGYGASKGSGYWFVYKK